MDADLLRSFYEQKKRKTARAISKDHQRAPNAAADVAGNVARLSARSRDRAL